MATYIVMLALLALTLALAICLHKKKKNNMRN